MLLRINKNSAPRLYNILIKNQRFTNELFLFLINNEEVYSTANYAIVSESIISQVLKNFSNQAPTLFSALFDNKKLTKIQNNAAAVISKYTYITTEEGGNMIEMKTVKTCEDPTGTDLVGPS